MFIWGLERYLAEKVSTADPKTLLSAMGIVEDLELAIRFAHRPFVKGAAKSLSGMGTQVSGGQQQMQWRGGRRGAGVGGEVVADRANGVEDLVQAMVDGHLVQL